MTIISIFKSAATALALCLALQAHADTLLGKVVAVADGDTITVLDTNKVQHKIRLAGIDAPEKAQPYGQTSKQSLSDLVFGKTVTVDTDKTDRYGREVGKVLVDGVDTNLEQVRRGLAWHYKAYQREQSPSDRLAYAAAEKTPQRPAWACGKMLYRWRPGSGGIR